VTVGGNVAGIVRHRGYGEAKEANRLSFCEEECAESAFDCQKIAPQQAGSGGAETTTCYWRADITHKEQRVEKKAARDKKERTESRRSSTPFDAGRDGTGRWGVAGFDN
jgi:hypothetical protein